MNKRLLLALYDRSGLGAYMPVDYNGLLQHFGLE
jgi:hypothetical protein